MKKTIKIFLKAALCVIMAIVITVGGLLPATAAGSIKKDIAQKTVITETLEYMYKTNPGEKQRVMIWLMDIDTTAAVREAFKSVPNYADRLTYLTEVVKFSDKENQELSSYISTKREAMKSCYQEYTQNFNDKYLSSDDVIYISQYTPTIIAELTYEKAVKLSKNKQVKSIDFYCDDIVMPDEVNSDNLSLLSVPYYSVSNQVSYIHADDVWGTYADTGAGVNVGMIDVSLPNTSTGIIFTPHYTGEYNGYYPGTGDVPHASNVLEIIYSIAPDANFYCTSYNTIYSHTPTPTLITEIEWLLGCNVDVINISMSLDINGIDDGENSYGAISQYLDSIIYAYDVSIVMAAGNSGSTGILSGGMAYNAVTVGNYNRYSSVISGDSSYYSGSSLAYKPDISAPGYFTFTFSGEDSHGTSFAAPMVTGTIALIMSYRGSLRVNPTGIKSILTSSVSLSTSHHYDTRLSLNSYKQYGAGILDAYRAVSNAASYRYTTDWMDVDATIVDYYNYFSYGNTVRISLAFEKINFGAYGEDVTLADLNIHIYDDSNNLVCYSTTSNNNVEIVEFTPSATGTYRIKISNYEPATGYRDYYSIYSFSWVYS